MLRTRKKYNTIFGRGTIEFITHENKKALCYVRKYEGEQILCVFNMSKKHTYVELDLKQYKGYRPVEVITETRFPFIGDLPYFFTLPPHGFFWLRLVAPDTEDGIQDD